MTNTTTELQPDLWPDWVAGHPWLVSFLAKAEAEARNRGDTRCDHFHMDLAFLGLGPPVSEWLDTLGLDCFPVPRRLAARVLREDIVELLGMNAAEGPGVDRHKALLARGERARGARHSNNTIEEFPLASVDEFYTGEILELARAEAGLHGDAIDERHMLVALALLLFQGSPPPASALRYLTGLSRVEDTSYGVRVDKSEEWAKDVAVSHGADPTRFPYRIVEPLR